MSDLRCSVPPCETATSVSSVHRVVKWALVLALLALPSPALAQRDAFFSSLLTFHRSLAGLYGDEGPLITAQLAAMSTALVRWDSEIRAAETELRSRLQAADAQTKLQIHTLLASLYLGTRTL